MLEKSLNYSFFSFLCHAAFVKQLWRQGWISLLHTLLNSLIIIMKWNLYWICIELIVLLCSDLSWRHNAFTLDAGLSSCLLCDQRNLWWWKLLLTQTHCWHINISVIFYRAFSGILGTVKRLFKTIHDEQRLNCGVVWFGFGFFFHHKKSCHAFKQGACLFCWATLKVPGHCTTVLVFYYFFFKLNEAGHGKAII